MVDIDLSCLPLILGISIIVLSVLEIYLSTRRRRNEQRSRARTDGLLRDGE